jgi:DnaJ-class molecular chaperone
MFRLIILGLIIGVIFYFAKSVLHHSRYQNCPKCDGKGFWRETRGDRIDCKTCNGTGFLPKL